MTAAVPLLIEVGLLPHTARGTGIGVALIDSGLQGRPDLTNASNVTRVVYNQSFLPGGSYSDGYGHGTHVAGVIAGDGKKSTGSAFTRSFVGIAPEANIINLAVLDENGQGTDSRVIAAIQRAIDGDPPPS